MSKILLCILFMCFDFLGAGIARHIAIAVDGPKYRPRNKIRFCISKSCQTQTGEYSFICFQCGGLLDEINQRMSPSNEFNPRCIAFGSTQHTTVICLD